jgi:hypothetical protein
VTASRSTHEIRIIRISRYDDLSNPETRGAARITTHGEHFLQALEPAERESFQKGEPVIREQQQSGSNLCASFHPLKYAHETLAKNFTVVDFVPGSERGWSDQDIHLVKKPL